MKYRTWILPRSGFIPMLDRIPVHQGHLRFSEKPNTHERIHINKHNYIHISGLESYTREYNISFRYSCTYVSFFHGTYVSLLSILQIRSLTLKSSSFEAWNQAGKTPNSYMFCVVMIMAIFHNIKLKNTIY